MAGFDNHFYYPNRRFYEDPDAYGLNYEDVNLNSHDGPALHGWLIRAVGRRRGRVVHFHGNAGNISAHVGLIHWLPRAGFDVLMFDYRGYGRSAGRVSRAGTVADGHAAVNYLQARPDGGHLPIFAYGQSLGGAVALVVAADRPEIAGVVAEAPFSSYQRIAALHISRIVGLGWLARVSARVAVSRGHDPIDVVARIAPRPLLIIAAQRDLICFPESACELFQAAREPKELWIVPDVGHLEIGAVAGVELARRVSDFYERAAQMAGQVVVNERAVR